MKPLDIHFSCRHPGFHDFFMRFRPSLRWWGLRYEGFPHWPERAPNARFWFLSVYGHNRGCLPDSLIDAIRNYSGKLVVYALDDELPLTCFPYFPEPLRERVDFWCRMAYDHALRYPAVTDGKRVLMPPYLPWIARRRYPIPRFESREKAVLFVGAFTGPKDPDANPRIKAVRSLKRSGIRFYGGVYPNREIAGQTVPNDVAGPRYNPYSHFRKLHRVAYSLVLPGYNPLTFRLFESLAAGALCFSPDLSRYDWLFGELKAGQAYVAVRDDFEDLADKIKYYDDHPAEAADIAQAGHCFYERFLRFKGERHNPLLLERFFRQFGIMRRPPGPLNSALLSLSSRVVDAVQPLQELEYNLHRGRGPWLA